MSLQFKSVITIVFIKSLIFFFMVEINNVTDIGQSTLSMDDEDNGEPEDGCSIMIQ